MDCKDLMVGDWVICNHYQDKPFTKQFGVADFAKGEYEFCEPIPLTEGILVKNGWRKHIMLYKNEWYGNIGLFEEHGKFYYMDLKIEYVHQLQHLLRLCGIEKELVIDLNYDTTRKG